MARTARPRGSAAVEWPTVLLIAGVYAAFGLVTWHADALPWWLLLPAGAYLVGLHGSLQHEAVHGHPTRSRTLNEALVFPSLALWVPYRRYRRLHLMHHRDAFITDPIEDPESWYVLPETWHALARSLRWLMIANNTLAGRLLLGPAIAACRFVASDLHAMATGRDREVMAAWALHGASLAVTLVWVVGVCGMDIGRYVALFAYPGTALTLLRSFAEHRAHSLVEARSAVIETNPAMALLYLNNNLHAAHHANPQTPWYRLPAYYRRFREDLVARNERYLIAGYGSLVRHYLLRPKEAVPHPFRTPGGDGGA